MDGYTKRYTDQGNFETIKQDRVGTYQVLGTNDETFNPGMLGSHLCIFGMFQRTYSWPIVYKLKSPRLTYNVGGSQSYLEGKKVKTSAVIRKASFECITRQESQFLVETG